MLLLLASPTLIAQYLLQIKPADTDSNAIAALRSNGKYQEIQGKYFTYDIYGQ